MKVLHVSTPITWRGGEQQVAYLCQGLKKMDVEQAVICPLDSILSSKLKELEVQVIEFKSRGFLDTGLGKIIADTCKQHQFDLLHVHDSHAHSAAVVSAAMYGNKAPILVSRRVDFPVSKNIFSGWKYNHPSVKKIICVSEMIRSITAPAIRDHSKLIVIHSGIDLSKYENGSSHNLQQELFLPDEVKFVGNLSALADHKDYPTFLRAAALMVKVDPHIHFVIAGTGPEEVHIRQLVKDHHLDTNVHMLGFRRHPESIMKSLDVFMITSSTEGLGTIVLEAFAAGIPVVATRAGGIPEMVEHEVTGLLCDVGNAEKLKEAVMRLFQDTTLKEKLVANASVKVQGFSYETTAEKTFAVYEKVNMT